MYTIINRERISEPNRGQNYSEFYFTTYVVVKYDSIEEEIKLIIENYLK